MSARQFRGLTLAISQQSHVVTGKYGRKIESRSKISKFGNVFLWKTRVDMINMGSDHHTGRRGE